MKQLVEEAYGEWKQLCKRDSHQARFGNTNAAKQHKMRVANKTEIPNNDDTLDGDSLAFDEGRPGRGIGG